MNVWLNKPCYVKLSTLNPGDVFVIEQAGRYRICMKAKDRLRSGDEWLPIVYLDTGVVDQHSGDKEVEFYPGATIRLARTAEAETTLDPEKIAEALIRKARAVAREERHG